MTATVQALVDSDWIARHLADETVRIVEVDVAPAAYREGHIRGAIFWNIYSDLRHPDYLPIAPAGLGELLMRSGIGPETTVVFHGYGCHLGYWLLRSIGHERARLMDGPREQWLETGLGWSVEAATVVPASCPPVSFDPRLEASLAEVRASASTILDVRSQLEYAGEHFWPSGAAEGAGRAGHIPGSVHLPIELLRSEDGRFKDPAELRRVFLDHGLTPDRRIVTYCTIGNRASQAWFALSVLLDYPDVAVYQGSWAEWGLRSDTPVETAPLSLTTG